MARNRPPKRDPTRTTDIRRRFEAEAVRRFQRLKSLIREALIELDVLGLRGRSAKEGINAAMFRAAFARDQVGLSEGAFAFERDPQKVRSFMAWLRAAERKEVLGIQEGVGLESAAEGAWTRTYVETAYQRGVAQAGNELQGAGAAVEQGFIRAAFNRPVHADRAGIIFTRTFSDLNGITAEMDKQISRVLSQGILEGRNPREIARQLNERVDRIGITRARVLARTEVINAHAEGTLNLYEEAGVEGVELEAEWTTAGDDRVCPDCEEREGRVMSLSEARGLIPLHPQCRCAWLPVVENAGNITLR
jgi:SPP1 gp7 family putative phage head morphogenesis protein